MEIQARTDARLHHRQGARADPHKRAGGNHAHPFLQRQRRPHAADHQPQGPLRGFKAQTWEGGIRIAFLMQWNAKIPAGKVDDRPVIQLAIHPTALAAAGVKAPGEAKFDGVNLFPYPTGEKSGPPHEALYWRFGQQIAIRSGDWKLVKGAGMASVKPPAAGGKATTEGAELYNVTADIGEKTNLAQKNPEKLKELAALWDTWNAGNIDAARAPGVRKNAPNAQPGDPAPPRRKRNQPTN
ncbi:MAG: sulfatase-like hydrolase/transferase [Verrucomicrobia bacterium]|nr:sulfatase-like hydrolase/transferase [Verrucomicrobiota bacterium]